MKKILCFILIINCCSMAFGSLGRRIISPNQTIEITTYGYETPIENMQARGHKSNPARVKFKASSNALKIPKESNVIEIREKSILYLPGSIEVVAIEPKTYTKEDLSKEIKKYYSINFPIFAVMFALYQLSQL